MHNNAGRYDSSSSCYSLAWLPDVTSSAIALYPHQNPMYRSFHTPMRFVHPWWDLPSLAIVQLSCRCNPNHRHFHSHALALCSVILLQGPKVRLCTEKFSQKSSCASSDLSPHSCQWPNLSLIGQGRDCFHQQSISLQNLPARLLLQYPW